VEVHAAHWSVVLVESVEECAHAVVPHLDDPAVEAGEDPWPARVEGEALDAVALGLELGQHLGAALRRPAGPLNPPAGAREREVRWVDLGSVGSRRRRRCAARCCCCCFSS
jgi:hypothetical protein